MAKKCKGMLYITDHQGPENQNQCIIRAKVPSPMSSDSYNQIKDKTAAGEDVKDWNPSVLQRRN